ncbi:MAG: hypothetical protein ACR2PK_11180 [Acidimicrobiales bacterium]
MRRTFVAMIAGLLALALLGAPAGAAGTDNSPLQSFEDGSAIGKGAHTSLKRSSDSIDVAVHSRNLVPGNAYTVWLAIFNDPAGCVDGCDGGDVFPGSPAAVSVIWSGVGGVANGGGNLNARASLSEGNPEGYQQLFTSLGAGALDPGFVDAEGAEIHMIVRDHGPSTGSADQVSTFEGECTAPSSEELGNGSYVCVDIQFSLHFP